MEIPASKSASAVSAPLLSSAQAESASKSNAKPARSTVDSYAFGHLAHLIGRLKAQESIRADEISRATKLAKDPDWPPARIVQDLARYFVAATKRPSTFEPVTAKISESMSANQS